MNTPEDTQKAPIVNALTIDFEDWYQGLEIPHTQWDGFEDRIVEVGFRLLRIFEEAGARATFFILGRVAEQHPELVRAIDAAGHEIGTHGYSHTLIYQQTPEVFREELGRSIRLLEDLTGRPVVGHRAPFFSITQQSLWALPILLEAGLLYDSSIFPVRNYRYGIANSDTPRLPHIMDVEGGRLWEFPISVLPMGRRNIPIAGGAYFRIYPYSFTRRAFRTLNRQGEVAVFYLHPWEIDPEHPRIPLPRRIALTHYFNLGATEGRLRRLLRDFRFAPMREVLGLN